MKKVKIRIKYIKYFSIVVLVVIISIFVLNKNNETNNSAIQEDTYNQETVEQQKERQSAFLLKAHDYCLKMNELAKNTYSLSSYYVDATDYCNNSLETEFFYIEDGCPPGAIGICMKNPRQF